LKYFGASYDAEVGRFITQDPKKQGENWYEYCFDNPINKVDRDGQFAETVLDAAFLATDAVDIINNPKDGVAWACLAADIVCAVTPGVTGGRVAVKGIEHAIQSSKGVWSLSPFERGRVIEQMLGRDARMANFPTIDKFEKGLNGFAKSVTSIKSIDLDAKTYSKGNNLYNTIMGYAREVAEFKTRTYNNVLVEVNSKTQRNLEIAVPHNPTGAQKSQVEQAIKDASDMGVNVTTETIE
jgi:RHS repeat-associated core domain